MESQKPFACPSPGCNMSFTNEDHLTVHKKRHDMMLNLESSNKNNIFIDQTPTPTRFIKNCEELGLFQDLQNVNPFDETFRRAVETGKTGTSVSDTDISDDALHTPQIFPHITDCQAANGQIIHVGSAIDELSSAPVATVIDVTKSDLLDSARNDNNENVFRHTEKTVDVVEEKRPKLDERVLGTEEPKQSAQSFENVERRASGAGNDREDFTTALSSDEKLPTLVIKTNPPLKSAKRSNAPRLSLAKLKLKAALTKGADTEVDQSRGISTGNDKEDDTGATLSREAVGKKRANAEQNKKQEKRERNRASSMRCRAKRKEWIQQLQQTISCANEKNAALQLEIKNLHTEIARLKTLLLAHKDCPITKAMEKGNSILIGSKVINVNPEVMQVAPQITVNSQLSAIPSTSPVVAKKGRLTALSQSKNTILVQKSELQPIPIQPGSIKKVCSIVKIVPADNAAKSSSVSVPFESHRQN